MTTQTQNGHAGFDASTGELTCTRCKEVRVGDVEILEAENRKLRRKVKALERDKDEERKSYRERKKVLSIIERWAEKTGHPKANVNATDRFDTVRARRKESYEWEHIELAVDGLAAFPFVVNGQRKREGKPSQKHDRLGICLGSGEQLEKFANLGARARKAGWI